MFKKLTRETKPGFFQKIRDALSIDAGRSSGVTFNENYRNPMPGSRPEIYKEPVTAPANDIAENPYYARDVRRQYPRTVHFTQGKVAGLLTYGNKSAPQIASGEAGTTAIATVEDLSLTQALAQTAGKDISVLFGKDGLPPKPRGVKRPNNWRLEREGGFAGHELDGEEYPVRMFS
ncbi:hypothetical protein PYCC9005_004434 [Savitreella phatthalungensis]